MLEFRWLEKGVKWRDGKQKLQSKELQYRMTLNQNNNVQWTKWITVKTVRSLRHIED